MAGTPPSIPQDMRDLLIRLDQRVDDGFKSMNEKLDAMNRRADGLDQRTEGIETRVRTLETWRSEVQGGAKGIGLGWKVGSAIFGAIAGILAWLGVQNVVAPTKPLAKQTETIERTIQVPR